MAQIHVSKDPSDKTSIACAYATLTRYIGSGQEFSISSPEFQQPYMAHFKPKKGRLRQINGPIWNVYHDI